MILFILLGYYMDDNIYKYESLVMAVVYCFTTMKYPIEHFCLGCCSLPFLPLLCISKRNSMILLLNCIPILPDSCSFVQD